MAKTKNKILNFFGNHIAQLIVLGVATLCAVFILTGTKSEDGSITLDGSNAKISESTEQFIEDSRAALNRLMNVDAPTDEETIAENEKEAVGLGFYTTIDEILNRRLPIGSKPYQCSRYTAYLATGKSVYSTKNIDYGPVNGKDVAAYLVKYYGFKYIDTPVKGAIGSGGWNTTYGHTALYLYSTGANTAMVEDANYVPLTVSTHNMNISGYKWVVPGSYEPSAEPTSPSDSSPSEEPVSSCSTISIVSGDTMGAIMKRCEGYVSWGTAMDAYAKTWRSTLVKPGQSVYDGWHSQSGIGLYAGDIIRRDE